MLCSALRCQEALGGIEAVDAACKRAVLGAIGATGARAVLAAALGDAQALGELRTRGAREGALLGAAAGGCVQTLCSPLPAHASSPFTGLPRTAGTSRWCERSSQRARAPGHATGTGSRR